jgi:hypothetical protein
MMRMYKSALRQAQDKLATGVQPAYGQAGSSTKAGYIIY